MTFAPLVAELQAPHYAEFINHHCDGGEGVSLLLTITVMGGRGFHYYFFLCAISKCTNYLPIHVHVFVVTHTAGSREEAGRLQECPA